MRAGVGAGEVGLQLGDAGVAFGQLRAEPLQHLVHVEHAVAAQAHRQPDRVHVGADQRAVGGSRSSSRSGWESLSAPPSPSTASATAATTATSAMSMNQNTSILPGYGPGTCRPDRRVLHVRHDRATIA